MSKKHTNPQKRPGPKPELISLYPVTFDEVLDTVLSCRPKNQREEKEKEVPDKSGAEKLRNST
ncbi:MAG: hypothetical protein ACLQPD_32680 [Desulfomonilaceae bacterium]